MIYKSALRLRAGFRTGSMSDHPKNDAALPFFGIVNFFIRRVKWHVLQ